MILDDGTKEEKRKSKVQCAINLMNKIFVSAIAELHIPIKSIRIYSSRFISTRIDARSNRKNNTE